MAWFELQKSASDLFVSKKSWAWILGTSSDTYSCTWKLHGMNVYCLLASKKQLWTSEVSRTTQCICTPIHLSLDLMNTMLLFSVCWCKMWPALSFSFTFIYLDSSQPRVAVFFPYLQFLSSSRMQVIEVHSGPKCRNTNWDWCFRCDQYGSF